MATQSIGARAEAIARLVLRDAPLTVDDVRLLLEEVRRLSRAAMRAAGHDPVEITGLSSKFRDAGRRSAPWRAFSGRMAGRPQDGADGNRINRWLLPTDHKYYADEPTATLVEIKYFLQALSMDGAPPLGTDALSQAFSPWLVEHDVSPGVYVEPVQLIPINLVEILHDRRRITSGHLVPLDRGGRHEPDNTFLIYSRSNQLQGNMTVEELLSLAEALVQRHRNNGTFPSSPKMPPEGIVKGVEGEPEA